MFRGGTTEVKITSQNKTLAIAILSGVLLLASAGCQDAGQESAGAGDAALPDIRDVPDPAMNPAAAEATLAVAAKADVLPQQITVDEEQSRIFIPELGWLPLAEFWDIYENNPARLPPSLDYKAVHRIKVSMAGKTNDDA